MVAKIPRVENVMELVRLTKTKAALRDDVDGVKSRLLNAVNYLGHENPLANRARNLASEIMKGR
jgi:hypothetical protein